MQPAIKKKQKQFVQHHESPALPICYADNWKSVFRHVDDLIRFLPDLERFLGALRLPVNPVWTLRNDHWCGARLPQAREIFGAAVAVRSFKKVVITLDCKGVVDTCCYLQRLLIDHSRVVLPSDNTDLWIFG